MMQAVLQPLPNPQQSYPIEVSQSSKGPAIQQPNYGIWTPSSLSTHLAISLHKLHSDNPLLRRECGSIMPPSSPRPFQPCIKLYDQASLHLFQVSVSKLYVDILQSPKPPLRDILMHGATIIDQRERTSPLPTSYSMPQPSNPNEPIMSMSTASQLLAKFIRIKQDPSCFHL